MIARHRGDLRTHSRWRPSLPASAPPQQPEPTQNHELQCEEAQLGPEQPRQRRPRTLIAVVTLVAVTIIAGQQYASRAPAASPLPLTPQQWVDQWTAASLNNPRRVCGQLFAPALAKAFRPDTGHSCSAYYSNVKSTSFRIRHVLQNGGSAAVEARQVGALRNWGYFTVLLSHVHRGWQAIDIVPGGPVRPR